MAVPAGLSAGTRIELVNMPDDPDPIEPGTRGTITYVGPEIRGHPQYNVAWDNGRTLGLAPIDTVRVLHQHAD